MYIKKESKIKNFFSKFKELWSDRRYRSIIKLSLYFIFFAIIFLFLGLSTKNEYSYDEVVNFEDYVSYEFVTNININDNIYNLNGERYYEKYKFLYNDEIFNLTYEDIQESYLDKNIINSFNFTPDLINNIINKSELVSEKKIISSNQIISEYSISLSKYLDILDFNLSNYDNPDFISIIVTESDNLVTKIELNLTNFYKNMEEDYFKYEISISYNSINSVNEF